MIIQASFGGKMFPEIDTRIDGHIRSVKEEVHRFAEEFLRPLAIEIDRMSDEEYQSKITRRDSLWWKAMKEIKKLGYNKILLPEMAGGPELTPLERFVIMEELAWGASGFVICLAVDQLPIFWALMGGRLELIEELNKKLSNLSEQACWAVTEPEHGTDMALAGTEYWKRDDVGLDCKARIEGDEVIISGAKSSWVSAAPCSTYTALHVSFEGYGKSPSENAGVVLVSYPYDGGKGVQKGKPLAKIGHRDNVQGELAFNEVRIPKEHILVNPGELELLEEKFLALTSAGMAMTWIGHARAALEEALKYVKQRKQGGKLIWQHQLIQQKLYDMFERVVTARAYARTGFEWIWNNFVVEMDPDKIDRSHVSVLQVYCKRIAFEVAHIALQIHGGNGITRDFLIEKLFRDTRPALIEDGTPDAFTIMLGNDIIKTYKV